MFKNNGNTVLEGMPQLSVWNTFFGINSDWVWSQMKGAKLERKEKKIRFIKVERNKTNGSQQNFCQMLMSKLRP